MHYDSNGKAHRKVRQQSGLCSLCGQPGPMARSHVISDFIRMRLFGDFRNGSSRFKFTYRGGVRISVCEAVY